MRAKLDEIVKQVNVGFHENVPLKDAQRIVHGLRYSILNDGMYPAIQALGLACPPNTTFQDAERDFMKHKEVRYVEKDGTYTISG